MASKGLVTVDSVLAIAAAESTTRLGLLSSPCIKGRRARWVWVKRILFESRVVEAGTDPGWAGYLSCQQCNPRFGGLAANYSTINFIQAAEFADIVARTPGGRVRADRAIDWPAAAVNERTHVCRNEPFFDAGRAARADDGGRRLDCRPGRGRHSVV